MHHLIRRVIINIKRNLKRLGDEDRRQKTEDSMQYAVSSKQKNHLLDTAYCLLPTAYLLVLIFCFFLLVSDIYAGESSSGLIIQDGHKKVVRSLSFSTDGNIIASGGLDRTVRLWDAHDMSLLKTFSGHTGSVNSIVISPDSKLLASGGNDRDIRLWDIEKRECIAVLSGHSGSIYSVAFSPDGDILVSASSDATVGIWNIYPVKRLYTKNSEITRLNDSDEGTSKGVRSKKPQFLTGHSGAVYAVAFSPDGRIFASGGADETIKLWDREKMTIVETILEEHERGFHPIYNLKFSFDGEILATAGAYPNVHLWDIKKKVLIKKLYDNSHAF